MRPRRNLRWGLPDGPIPKHPYRDTLLVYGVLAILFVLFAWATGASVEKAAIVMAVVFVVASAWSLVRWRERLRSRSRMFDGSDGEE